MYAITAILHRYVDGWDGNTSLPTFYLDERVQGIIGAESAERIARDIVMPHKDATITGCSISAVRVPGPDWDGESNNLPTGQATYYIVDGGMMGLKKVCTSCRDRDYSSLDVEDTVAKPIGSCEECGN